MRPQDVLTYWLGEEPGNAAKLEARTRRWFVEGYLYDEEIRERFGPCLKDARSGLLHAWKSSPATLAALVIVLDQIPRHVHRGTASSYASDRHAQELVLDGMRAGLDRRMTFGARAFFYMPLHHAEDLVHQARAVEVYAAMLELAEHDELSMARALHASAVEHHEVVRCFGRFPHRNAALGRESTPEEQEYLAAGAPRYGQ